MLLGYLVRPFNASSYALYQRVNLIFGVVVVAVLLIAGIAWVDVPPDLSSAPVSSPIPHEKEIGREDAFYRRADHWLPAGS